MMVNMIMRRMMMMMMVMMLPANMRKNSTGLLECSWVGPDRSFYCTRLA